MIDTEVLSNLEVAEPLVGSGRGGDGWGDDDSGDEWGWSGGPFGDDGDDRPYRRPRMVRAVALITAVAVVFGSIGTWVVILAVGSPVPSYAVSSVRMTVPSPGLRTTTNRSSVKVSFVVANESTLVGRASCRAIVSTVRGTVGSTTVRTETMPGGESASLTTWVPLNPTRLSGHGPASAQVSCRPTVSSGSRRS